MILFDPRKTLVDGSSSNQLFIKTEQNISDDFLADCKAKRDASMAQPMGEMHQFASIPRAVYDAWIADGFDPAKAGAKAVMARLRAEGLDSFITTNRVL